MKDDTISRSAAIDALNLADDRGQINSILDVIDVIKALSPEEPSYEAVTEYCRKRCLSIVDTALLEKYVPPAQPEIIRCKNCIHWGKYPVSTVLPQYHKCGMVATYKSTKGDDFCSDGKDGDGNE